MLSRGLREPRPFHHQPDQHTSPQHLLSASHETNHFTLHARKKSNPVAMNSSQSAQGMLCIMVQRLHGFSTRKPGTGRLAVLSCTVCFFSDGESILANSRYREQSHSILCRQYECSSNELEVAKCFVGSQSVLPTSWSLSGEETTSLNVL